MWEIFITYIVPVLCIVALDVLWKVFESLRERHRVSRRPGGVVYEKYKALEKRYSTKQSLQQFVDHDRHDPDWKRRNGKVIKYLIGKENI